MDTETLLEQHQQDLRELCAEFWGYALSTAPADRERLERAIARVYQDHDLKPPSVLWVNSVLDAKCCAALCTFISDPNVHFSMTGPFGLWKGRQGPVTNTPLLQRSFCGTGLAWARRQNRQRNYTLKTEQEYRVKLRTEFPTLFTEAEPLEPVSSRIWKTFLQLAMDDEIPYFAWRQITGGHPESLRAAGWVGGLPPKTPIPEPVTLHINQDSWRDPLPATILEEAAREFHEHWGPRIEAFDEMHWLAVWGRYDSRAESWVQFGPKYLDRSKQERAEVNQFLNRIAGLESFQCFNPLGEAITCAQAQAREVLGLERIPNAEPLIEAVKAGGWWWPLEGICIAIDNPLEIHFDARFRFHNDNGMAFCFREIDFGFWSVQGVRVPEKVMTDQFSVDDILTERNAEVRRVMINRYGISRFLIDTDAEKIDVDEFGTLYRKALSSTRNAQLCVVEVINKTPEPDGSFKVYHLHVPPNMMSAREAVAWTFGMRAEEYNPLQES